MHNQGLYLLINFSPIEFLTLRISLKMTNEIILVVYFVVGVVHCQLLLFMEEGHP